MTSIITYTTLQTGTVSKYGIFNFNINQPYVNAAGTTVTETISVS